MRNRPLRPVRWWARILLVPFLAAALTAASGTAAPAALTAASGTGAAAEPAPACRVLYGVTGAFPPVLVAELEIVNLGQVEINGWTLRFAYPDKQPLRFFGAELLSRADGIVTTRDVGYNADVPSGGTVTISYLTTVPAPTPTDFAVNGAPCLA